MDSRSTYLDNRFAGQCQDAANLRRILEARGIIPSGADANDLERIHRAGGFSEKDGRRISMLWKLEEHCIPRAVATMA